MTSVTCATLCDIPDQGFTNACAGFTFSRILKCAGVDCSPMWAYYVGRVSEGSIQQDNGVTHYGVVSGLEEMGVVPLSKWPVDRGVLPSSNFIYNLKPTPLSVALRVQETMDAGQLQSLLRNDHPVGVVLRTVKSVDDFLLEPTVYASIIAEIPDLDSDINVGHSVLITGFDKGVYKLTNSHGKSSGIRGHFMVTEKMMHNPQLATQFAFAT